MARRSANGGDFRPMLAATGDTPLSELPLPCLISPKFDGIRALRIGGKFVSRKILPIPNVYTQYQFRGLPDGLDGELIYGEPTAPNCYNATESIVMSDAHRAGAAVKYCVFDTWNNPNNSFSLRVKEYEGVSGIIPVEHRYCNTQEEIDEAVATILAAGYEGAIARAANGPYKYGRSTAKQNWMRKIKPLEDEEVRVIGFQELMRNDNELSYDALGLAKRSSHQANQTPMGTLGALIVNWRGHEAKVGIFKGISKADLQAIWDVKETYLGKLCTIRYQAHGMKDLPRSARFIGWRHEIDL